MKTLHSWYPHSRRTLRQICEYANLLENQMVKWYGLKAGGSLRMPS